MLKEVIIQYVKIYFQSSLQLNRVKIKKKRTEHVGNIKLLHLKNKLYKLYTVHDLHHMHVFHSIVCHSVVICCFLHKLFLQHFSMHFKHLPSPWWNPETASIFLFLFHFPCLIFTTNKHQLSKTQERPCEWSSPA